MPQTSRTKVIELIFVSWKDAKARCLSLRNRPFSSSVPNPSLVIRLYAEAQNIDFFEISRNLSLRHVTAAATWLPVTSEAMMCSSFALVACNNVLFPWELLTWPRTSRAIYLYAEWSEKPPHETFWDVFKTFRHIWEVFSSWAVPIACFSCDI